jgi:hypothetical protein
MWSPLMRAQMGEVTGQICSARCTSSVPPELLSTGLCVSHYTYNVERVCAEMHRQIAMRGMSSDRQTEVTVYLEGCALVLARVASSLSLSDILKRRVLSTFMSLMNLRETLERAAVCAPPMRAPKAAQVSAQAVTSVATA